MAKNVLVDAGFLVALLSRRGLHHAWAVIQAPRHAPPWRTCEAVLSEAFDRARTAKGFRLYRFLIGLTSFLAKT